ncbi:Hypothetical predicted protein [Mytilus galloprovincialis]|uniref:Uncharacterized protein n=1 Tax=Mytilus galloprovincialis TaxID=29158 RepID=A0A8B6D2S5_MYTGA|nr:Hypothetical predicted protein [Mytilus galloprovincialis]
MLHDIALLAKLSAGDLVAQEAKYHAKCLLYLYRKASRVANDDGSEGRTQTRVIHGVALAELVSFTEETRSKDNIASVFIMSDLSKMYGNRLEKMEAEQESRVHINGNPRWRVTESLSDSYVVVKPAVLKTNVPVIPVRDRACEGCIVDLQEAVQIEYS